MKQLEPKVIIEASDTIGLQVELLAVASLALGYNQPLAPAERGGLQQLLWKIADNLRQVSEQLQLSD